MKKKNVQVILFTGVMLALLAVFLFYYREKLGRILASDDLLGTVLANIKQIAGMHNFNLNFFLANLLVTLACFGIEAWSVGWEKSTLHRMLFKRDRSTSGDLWCWFLSLTYVYNIFTLLFSFGIFYVLTSLIVKNLGFKSFNLILNIENTGLQFIIVFVLSDLKHFVRHFLCHKINFLWELHKYHHSAEHMNIITSQRGHFIEAGFITLFDALLFVITGTPASFYLSLVLLREAHVMLTHSEVNWNWGWVGKYILISPTAHRLHHSRAPEHYNKNYGNLFVFWDSLVSYTRLVRKIILTK